MASLASAVQAWATYALPPPETRIPWTLPRLLLLAVPGAALTGASFIRLRLPNTPFILRLAYLFVASTIMVHTYMSHYSALEWFASDGISHSFIHFDFISGMASFVGTLLIIELLFLGEESDFEIRDVDVVMAGESKKENGSTQAKGSTTSSEDARASSALDARQAQTSDRRKALARPWLFPGTIVPLDIDMLSSVRGLGYNRGLPQATAGYRAVLEAKKVAALPKDVARAQKWQTVRSVLWTTLKAYIVLDVCESIVQDPRLFPMATRHGPFSIEDTREGALGRFGPIAMTLLAGTMILAGIQYIYGIVYSITVLLTSPQTMPITRSRFEPWMIGKPWKSSSIRDLWGNHWHALFRRILVICAYKPTRTLTRKLQLPSPVGRGLATVAAFLLSGLAHEMCLEAAVPRFASWDTRGLIWKGALPHTGKAARSSERGFGAFNFAVTRFFVYQGFVIILEEAWVSQIEPALAKLLTKHKPSQTFTANGNGHVSGTAEKRKEQDKPRLVTDETLRAKLGLLWTVAFMGWAGMLLIEALARHGCFEAYGTFRIASSMLRALESLKR